MNKNKKKMIKKAFSAPSLAPFHGVMINASKDKLVEIFGEPSFINECTREKVQNEWLLEYEDEFGNKEAFILYDWKEYRPYADDEVLLWYTSLEQTINDVIIDELRGLGLDCVIEK